MYNEIKEPLLFKMFTFNDRIKLIKKGTQKGKYIIYWMQGAFRTDYNHSLEFAIYLSNKLRMPLIVLVILNLSYPQANYRSFRFFLKGVENIYNTLKDRNISLHLKVGTFEKVMSQYKDIAHTIITDKSYLLNLKLIKLEILKTINATCYEVDTNLVVPVEIASNKMEYGAYTLRPKIKKIYEKFLNDFLDFEYKDSCVEPIIEVDFRHCDTELRNKTEYVSPIELIGGQEAAEGVLKDFIENKFPHYLQYRNDPTLAVESNLSSYLHFGHISPIKILKQLSKADYKNYEAFFEQLVVRRELAHNFTFYADSNKFFNCLPLWAKNTLNEHKNDKKDYIYDQETFEKATTCDKYWNVAQRELLKTGKIHNYMRMYWGKKIIEWSENLIEAYNTMIYLNNKYAVDGRDPNSYTGILWCFGLHDRPFRERSIFGKVRYMSENGLKNKFDIEKYYQKWCNK